MICGRGYSLVAFSDYDFFIPVRATSSQTLLGGLWFKNVLRSRQNYLRTFYNFLRLSPKRHTLVKQL